MDKKLILNKLKEYKKFSTNAEFARYIGITPQNLRNWYDRDTYDINKLCIAFPEVSAEWLMTGEGSMLRAETTASLSQGAESEEIRKLKERIKELEEQNAELREDKKYLKELLNSRGLSNCG